MDYKRGYTAAYKAVMVDQETWGELEAVAGIAEASVTRSCKSSPSLLETGRLVADTAAGGLLPRGYYRLKAYLVQDGALNVEDVATLLVEPSKSETAKGRTTWQATGYSVLKPAADAIIERGSYVARGEDGAAWAAEALADVLAAPVEKLASFTMGSTYVFDIGETVLGAVWRILEAGSCCMRIEGDGTVRIVKKPTEQSCDVVPEAPKVTDVFDLAAIPNRYHAIDGAEVATAENKDPDSPTSLANRHPKDFYDDAPAPVDGESLAEYAERKLLEMRNATSTRTYSREYDPTARPFDVTAGDGLRIVQQEIKLGRGITVEETAERTVLA